MVFLKKNTAQSLLHCVVIKPTASCPWMYNDCDSCKNEQQLLFLITKVLLQSHGHSPSSTWYTTLGLGASASNADVRRAYRQLAGKWHPDKWVNKSKSEQEQASQRFADISDAYAALNNA